MEPADLAKLNIPSDPRLSPDGEAVLFTVSRPNLDDDRYDQAIWIADADGSRPFTDGPRDTNPRWSPDGRSVAFTTRQDDKAKPQVAVMPAGGGEARVVTDFDRGVEVVEWSPDGSRLAVVAVTYVDEWAGIDEDERKRIPRRVTSVPYRFDNRGWTHNKRRHVWLVDPEGSEEPRCLTPGEYDEEYLSWSPDGERVAFISDRDPARGLRSGNEVFEVAVGTGEIREVASRGFWMQTSYSPTGRLHLLGNADPVYPVNSLLYRVEDEGTLTDLTGKADRNAVSLSAGPARIAWEGTDAIVGREDSGRFELVRVSPEGAIQDLLTGEQVVTGFDAAGGRVVATYTTPTSPGELYDTGEGGQLTRLNADGVSAVAPEHFTVTSAGHDIDVWVYLPEGDHQIPLLLNIHGGPASQYGFGFFDEFQVYVDAGYGVVASNPRGSTGKGEAFTRAVTGDRWGEVDLEDIRAVVAAALERYPRLDENRMGVMGGSYGGFLTGWIIGHEDRWKSAVVERALTSWTSFSGTSDIGGSFPENYLGVPYPEGWERWWNAGPLSIAHKVTTPTLILHAEHDWRCPIEQGEQFFMALLRNGTPTEMVRFPGEGHEMSRSGSPVHRKERFDAILDWHGLYLMG